MQCKYLSSSNEVCPEFKYKKTLSYWPCNNIAVYFAIGPGYNHLPCCEKCKATISYLDGRVNFIDINFQQDNYLTKIWIQLRKYISDIVTAIRNESYNSR
jgi:hypothetical protein